ncbi:hypothetical protein EUTSA_v10004306mg [Eutrema salsugineum]|uniref:Peptidase A1 domain-containing protein n=1 Tax=Eutrema salsugineum TaxID=72664 RepID=V4KLD8_EUTSA|nr:aspartic proteinase nepenthesin-1 [Eutrema salsugineum]ESQ32019.1 hypothetical protein EUTSA_v10004306mg [Eutrema salsugineum]
MVSSIIPLLLLLLLFQLTLATHNSGLEDDLSNDQPSGFFLPFESNLYVEITIGTPTRTFNLKLDSSTQLTFLECDPCDDEHQCDLSDTTRRYDGKFSTTFSPISCNNSSLCPHLSPNVTNHYNATKTTASLSLLCTPSNFCRYDVASFSAGNLVSDTLQLTSSITDQENSLSIVHGFVFGCGTSNRVKPEDDGGGVDGRVSLTTHHFSLLSQLRITRYSHCLWPSSAGSRNYIRLGSAAEYGGDMMPVPMLNMTETNSYSYHIALFGISLEEHRMRSNESSTMAIDIGTYYTRLEISLYEEVKEEIMTQIGPTVAYEVNELMCFTTEVGLEIESLPKLTLHFQGFNFTISNKGFYLRDSPSSFCTALVRSTMEDEEKNVLGASGLFDFAVGYDTSERMLAFQQRDCLADFVDGI